jgi:RNA polymerase sigma-70 factor (ECF subfamily)
MEASGEAVVVTGDSGLNLEAIFHGQYERIARVISRVIRDPGRAEELAVDVFLKWSRTPKAQAANAEGWLYRAAVRKGLDEIRRETRRSRYESLLGLIGWSPSPDEVFTVSEEKRKVRLVLSVIEPRHAELLLLRSHGLSYDELASTLDLNPASIGTFLSRAQRAFRKEYIKRYGEQ